MYDVSKLKPINLAHNHIKVQVRLLGDPQTTAKMKNQSAGITGRQTSL